MGAYLYLGAALGAIALIGGAYGVGHRAGADHEAVVLQKQIDRMSAAQKRMADAAQAIDEGAAERDVQRQTIVREIIREIPQVVDRPVYRNVCIDADGVGLLRRSVEAANGELDAGAAGSRPDGEAGGVQPATDHH